MAKRQQNYTKTKRRKWAFRRATVSSLRHAVNLVLCGAFLGVVLLLFSYFLLPAIHHGDEPAKTVDTQADPSDSFNMLMVTNDRDGNPAQMMLLRLDASKGHIFVLPVPTELSVSGSEDAATLGQVASKDGVSGAVAALEKAAGIKIPYRCLVKADNIGTLLAVFGGFVYDVPYSFSASSSQTGLSTEIQKGRNLIDDKKLLTLMTYDGYEQGTLTRYQVQASMMKNFWQQKLTDERFDNSGNFFKNVFGLVQTNFSLVDLLNRTDSFKAVIAKKDFVVSVVPTYHQVSENGESVYQLNASTKAQIKRYFSPS